MVGILVDRQGQFNTSRDGQDLEDISDKIDAVNVLKDQARRQQQQQPQLSNLIYDASPSDTTPDKTQFRQYEDASDRVKSFYLEQHTKQTVAYNLSARASFHASTRARMSIWDAIEKLNTLIDESDPDTSLSQIEHLLQTAEAMRRDHQPRWMQLTGLIHDLGKLLYFFPGTQGQWDVVGDTFPVGCPFSPAIIYGLPSFSANPNAHNPIYNNTTNTHPYGIYTPACGLDNLMLSWGHDEYLYHVVKDQCTLPDEALAMIRYHSFYPWHKEGAYSEYMDEEGKDERMLAAVRRFNPYDLYSKADGVPDVEELKVCTIFNSLVLVPRFQGLICGLYWIVTNCLLTCGDCSRTIWSLSMSSFRRRLLGGRIRKEQDFHGVLHCVGRR